MSSSRKYTCPYCKKLRTRDQLPGHLERNHLDVLPEGFTPLRMTFHIVNKKPLTYTRPCRICGGPTQWDEHKGRYNFLCGKKSCHDAWVKKMQETMGDKMGSNRPTSTKEGLAKMLAARKISGTYKFQDGGEHSYVGDYEYETLKFMDQVMNIKSEDIITPGPFLEYLWEGKTHYYIPDMYYIPYNLIIEVKDGGKNPNNNKAMSEVRRRSIAKEKFIIEHTDYNYLKLTDKDFSQLLSVFADLKMHMIDNDKSRVIHVNEDTDIINEKYTDADWKRNKNLSPVYVINTFIGSDMGILMRDFLNMTWSHALISFDASLKPMYSFDRVGLHIDDIDNYKDPSKGLVKTSDQGLMRVVVLLVPPRVKSELVKSVEYYKKNIKKTKYGALNLIAYLNGSNKINSYGDFDIFCSEFVDAILKNAKIDMSGHSSRNTSPDDLGGKDARAQFFKVYEGLVSEYNPKKTDQLVDQLKRTVEYHNLTVNGGENHMKSKDDIILGKKDSWPVVGRNTLNMMLHRNSVNAEGMDLGNYLDPTVKYFSEADGGGGIPANCGTMDGVIVVNYLQNNVFDPDGNIHDKPEYGIADNFRLDNIITNAGDKILHKETVDLLRNAKYSVYFVPCDKKKVYSQLEAFMNKPVPNNFIYQTVFGHKPLTNDQIMFENGIIKITDYYQQLYSIQEAISDYIRYAIVAEPDEDKQILDRWYVQSTDGAINCCLKVRGYEKPMRGRSSMLILKQQLDDWYVLLDDQKQRYSAPGGGWDEHETPMEAAIREAREEVRVNVTDVQYGGILIEYYDYVQDWVKQHVPQEELRWYGYYSRIYVGMYQSQYTGKIDDIDKDPRISTSKWYKVQDLVGNSKMPQEYINAIAWYIYNYGEKNNTNESAILENLSNDRSKSKDIQSIIDSLSPQDLSNLNMPKNYQFDDSKSVKEIVKYRNNIPVAYFNIDMQDDFSADVSFAVRSDCRGKGYGREITRKGTEWIKSHLKEFTTVYWAAKPKNIGSWKLAEKNGWIKVRDDNEWKTYAIKGAKEPLNESSDILNMTPEELSKWMKNNIKYANFTRLKSHDEVLKSKCGSCHDQVMFELEELKAYHPKAIFLIETNDNETTNAVTHSFVYYQNNNRLYYFENAWGGHAGIKEFNDLNEIKEYFIKAHNKKEFGDPNRYPQILFFDFGIHKPGETLNEFVTKATRTEIHTQY